MHCFISSALFVAVWDAAAQFHLGDTYFEMGDFPKSKEHYGRAVWAFEHNQSFPSWVGFGKVGEARSKALNKDSEGYRSGSEKSHEVPYGKGLRPLCRPV
jgi:hypothetical protein